MRTRRTPHLILAVATMLAALATCSDGGPGLPSATREQREGAGLPLQGPGTPWFSEDALFVLVGADGRPWVRGVAVDHVRLQEILREHAEMDRDPACPWESSRAEVTVLAEPGARWGALLHVLQRCTAPEVRMVRLRVGLPGGPVFTPRVDAARVQAAAGGRIRLEEEPTIEVRLRRGPDGRTEVTLLDSVLGAGGPALEDLGRRVGSLLASVDVPELGGRIRASTSLPCAVVMEARGRMAREGCRKMRLAGLPPTSWELWRALERLAHSPDDRAREDLVRLLWHADPRVGAAALEEVRARIARPLPLLLSGIERRGRLPGDIVLRVPGGGEGPEAEVLASFGEPAIPELTAALASGRGPLVRRSAIGALGLLASPRPAVLDALRRAAEDPDDGVRAAVARALERIGSRR